ncbi:MAG TPA: hypothetical protein VG498_07910 [Terriglobales bacterium]|nr:hypothetical protein [Terriglobales bacterium]
MPQKQIQKEKPRPKRSIKTPGDDHELGLWIDYDLLRKFRNGSSPSMIHDGITSRNNRYLELADLALGNRKNGKSKKRSKSAGAS